MFQQLAFKVRSVAAAHTPSDVFPSVAKATFPVAMVRMRVGQDDFSERGAVSSSV